MSDSPFFSIIIPTYNRADVIAETIDSVLKQRFKNFELIVVDDGGTDHTEEVVNSFDDGRIQYFKKENAERGAARNYGAKRANGKYLNFLDSDDLLYPNHLKVAHRFIQENQAEVFFQHYDILVNQVVKTVPFPKSKTVNQLLVKKGNFLSCDGSFINRKIFSQHQFSENRALSASEDYELWLRLAARYPIYYVKSTTSSIVFHDERSVLNVQAEGLVKRKELMLSMILSDVVFMKKYGRFKKDLCANAYAYLALHLCLAGHKKRGLQYLNKTLKQKPSIIFNRKFWAILKHVIF